ncbi:hypothetical protein U14_02717 [Candidatus Moduliflexus flocculans]|uniref:Nif11 domain-containing protein n=1 Tax=Candidatus Moduliflexus flocculans TaxID=1499966 RepID=A0A081BM57_9BACT|nr:hypothetical protein U14_02717 [Candidatus Moduliflexus flocculans]
MSVENFKKFGQLCAEDEKIRERVKAIGIENVDGWIAYSKNELGLEFDNAIFKRWPTKSGRRMN